MRIIGGKYARRRFDAPHGMKLRPTTDMAKEGLFSTLYSLISFEELRVLDLFAGTGNIGIEFISRGAQSVLFVDKNRKHLSFIKSVIDQLEEASVASLLQEDVFKFLRDSQHNKEEHYDIVFADPPYNLNGIDLLPDLILSLPSLVSNAIVVLEHPNTYDFSMNPFFIKHKEYSAVNFSIFRKE